MAAIEYYQEAKIIDAGTSSAVITSLSLSLLLFVVCLFVWLFVVVVVVAVAVAVVVAVATVFYCLLLEPTVF